MSEARARRENDSPCWILLAVVPDVMSRDVFPDRHERRRDLGRTLLGGTALPSVLGTSRPVMMLSSVSCVDRQ